MSAVQQLLLGYGASEVEEAYDAFTGVADGTVTGWASGTGWNGAGVIEDPVANASIAVDAFTGLTDGTLVSFGSGSGGWNGSGVIDDAPPVADPATDGDGTNFTANWHSLAGSGATGYRLDVSTASDFSSFVSGYENLDVGLVTTYAVTGPGENTYYYRVRSYNGVTTSPNSNVRTVAPAPTEFTYHRVDYKVNVGSGNVSLTEFKFKLWDDSDYPLASSTLTSPHSWSYAGSGSPFSSMLKDGNITAGISYGTGDGTWASLRVQTPAPVAVKSVLSATQSNFNGPFHIPSGIRYYTSTNGTDWTLVKEVLGDFGSATGYIEKNVEP